MSWKEFDNRLTKLFESFHAKVSEKKEEKDEPDPLSSASSPFVNWLDNHIQECRMEEDFPKIRLICVKCGDKITDDRFVVISHPRYPGDYSKAFYSHSKGGCNPQWEQIHAVRERWLKKHDKHYQERERQKKELIEVLLSRL
ncbi:MAG: hypothetical protein ACFFAE_00755 [Candidatus Hodarchaeota archaeon]